MALFNFTKEGKGIAKDEAEAPVIIQFFKRYGRNFWRIVLLNLLYLFACAPIVTIGPATAGLTYVLRNYSQDKPVDMFPDFFGKCKEYFGKGIAVFFLDVLIIAVGCFSAYMWSDDSVTIPSFLRTLALFFVFFLLYIFICANFYVYPMMVSFDLPLKKVIKNSIILGMYKIGPNLIMLVLNALIVIGCVFTWPASLSVIILLPFSTCNFLNNFIVYPVLVKTVALPEEKPAEQNEDDVVFHDTI